MTTNAHTNLVMTVIFSIMFLVFWNGTKIECVKALEVKDLYIGQKNR